MSFAGFAIIKNASRKFKYPVSGKSTLFYRNNAADSVDFSFRGV